MVTELKAGGFPEAAQGYNSQEPGVVVKSTRHKVHIGRIKLFPETVEERVYGGEVALLRKVDNVSSALSNYRMKFTSPKATYRERGNAEHDLRVALNKEVPVKGFDLGIFQQKRGSLINLIAAVQLTAYYSAPKSADGKKAKQFSLEILNGKKGISVVRLMTDGAPTLDIAYSPSRNDAASKEDRAAKRYRLMTRDLTLSEESRQTFHTKANAAELKADGLRHSTYNAFTPAIKLKDPVSGHEHEVKFKKPRVPALEIKGEAGFLDASVVTFVNVAFKSERQPVATSRRSRQPVVES